MELESNGVVRRRFSRAYDQPTIQNTTKGSVVVRADLMNSNTVASDPSNMLNPTMDAVGGVLARVTLTVLTLVGALVGLFGKASLDAISQFVGFMLMFLFIFMACTGTFYWWANSCKDSVKLTLRKVLHIYGVCALSDILARSINMFSRMPESSLVPEDISYFFSLTTLLMLTFAMLFHKNGLNAMFSKETVLFVVISVALNYSTSRLFLDILPKIFLPQMIHSAALLGLSMSFAGYSVPRISPSGLYWMLQGRKASLPTSYPLPNESLDHTPPQSSGKISSASGKTSVASEKMSIASVARASVSSSSSMNSSYPQVCPCLKCCQCWSEVLVCVSLCVCMLGTNCKWCYKHFKNQIGVLCCMQDPIVSLFMCFSMSSISLNLYLLYNEISTSLFGVCDNCFNFSYPPLPLPHQVVVVSLVNDHWCLGGGLLDCLTCTGP